VECFYLETLFQKLSRSVWSLSILGLNGTAPLSVIS